MSEYKCEFCDKILSTKGSLKIHIKTNKNCLRIRNEQINLFKCQYCEKNYSSKQNYDNHNCNISTKKLEEIKKEIIEKEKEIIRKDTLIEEKNKQIASLEERLAEANAKISELATIGMKKDTTTNIKTSYKVNQNIMNKLTPFNLTPESVKDIVEKNFTYKHLIAGKEGISKFAVEFILTENDKYKMICTDSSRRIFMYIDDDNNVYRDRDAIKFMDEMFIPTLVEKSNEIIRDKLKPELDDAIRDLLLKIHSSVIGEVKNDKSVITTSLSKKLKV
jgi:hypothetical protein